MRIFGGIRSRMPKRNNIVNLNIRRWMFDVSRHGGIRRFEKTVSSGPPIQNSKLPSECLFIFFCVKENEPKETARVPLLSALLATGGSCETRCAQTVTVSLRLLLRCSTRPNGKGLFLKMNVQHRIPPWRDSSFYWFIHNRRSDRWAISAFSLILIVPQP